LAIALVGGVWFAPATEPPFRAVPGDDCRVLLLVDSRPRLVCFHVQSAGKPYRVGWDESVGELFRFLDVNGDGNLDEKELSRAPGADQFLRILQGAEDLEPAPAPEYKTVSGEGGDSKVTLDHLAAYYARSRAKPLAAEWIVKGGKGDALSDALFRRLDADGDGKLSPAELAGAPTLLDRFDTDLDELISPVELLGTPPVERYSRPLLDHPPSGKIPPLLLLDSDSPRDAAVDCLLSRYDANKDGRLSREEMGFEEELFARLDRNKDKTLDRQELTGWLAGPPELEILVRLSGTGGPAIVAPRAVGPGRTGIDARPTRYGSLLLTVPGAELDILVRGGEAPIARRDRGRLEALFRGLDANKDNVLESREVFKPPFTMVPYLRLADGDGDGKLTWQEWSAFLDLREKIAASAVLMTWLDRGPRLFDFLDANHDGRLSRRELAGARARLAPYMGNGALRAENLPAQSQLLFQFGRPNENLPPNTQDGPNVFTPAPRVGGPLWFRKMDRNRDGDVSPREFLGTLELFQRIDADGDGLIDADEAERADLEYRRHAPGRR
jgi:Ca2+-binding EF-hand superfamily protein